MNAKQAAAKRQRIERMRQNCHDNLDIILGQGVKAETVDRMRLAVDQLAERTNQLISKTVQQRGG